LQEYNKNCSVENKEIIREITARSREKNKVKINEKGKIEYQNMDIEKKHF
jgi:hypothetical protein